MRIRFSIALITLLTPVLAGCQSTLISPLSTPDPFPETSTAGYEPRTRETFEDPTTNAQLEQSEFLPAPLPLPLPLPAAFQQTTPNAELGSLSNAEGDSRSFSLADLEAIAYDNNPTLSLSAARMDAARGRQLQAGRYPNPVIGYHATEVGNRNTAGGQGGFIGQRYVTAGKLKLDQAIAGSEVDEAHFRMHAQEQKVLNDVRLRFYDAIIAQRRVELSRELAQIGSNLVKATEKLLQSHRGTENDLLQAQIREEQAQILLDDDRNQELETWRRLAAVIGLPTMVAAPLSGQLGSNPPELDWETCYAKILGGNPELDAARARIERESSAIRRAELELIPNLDFFLSLRHHNVTSDDVANVQVGIPIPLFDRNRGNIQSAKARWIAAMNEVERIELDLQDRLAVAFRRYANALQQTDRHRLRIVPRAKRSLELVTVGYDAGQVDYQTMLAAQRTHLQVSLSQLDSLGELWKASTLIEGQLLKNSLGRSP